MTKTRSFRVVLETPDGLRSFVCGPTDSIWDAAAGNNVYLPAICHHGRCLTCAGLLIEGKIEHDHPDLYFPQDAEARFVLLCCAMPETDVRIRTHQEWEMREHRTALGLPSPYG